MGQGLCYLIFSVQKSILKFLRQQEIWFTYEFPNSHHDWLNKEV